MVASWISSAAVAMGSRSGGGQMCKGGTLFFNGKNWLKMAKNGKQLHKTTIT